MVVRRQEFISGGLWPELYLRSLWRQMRQCWIGATCNLQTCQGCWNVEQNTLNINILDMEAVIQSVLHFHTMLKGKLNLLRSDNVAVVTYINKLGVGAGGAGWGWGGKVPISMHEDLAVVQISQGHVLHDYCYSFRRRKKCRSRSLVPWQGFTEGVWIIQQIGFWKILWSICLPKIEIIVSQLYVPGDLVWKL